MLAVFERLGAQVAQRWAALDLRPDVFCDVAADLLAEAQLHRSTGLEEIARWFTAAENLPSQQFREFGQPPINVYNGNGFYIEVLFWVDTPTSIHQHGFSGAFCVLDGASLHCEYAFDTHRELSKQLRLGELKLTSSEVLRTGDVRAIAPGDRFIHSLLHLQSPSISVVVRTPQLPQYQPQYRYSQPGLASDPFYRPEPLQTQVKLLGTVSRSRPELHAELAESLVRRGDIWTAYSVVKSVAAAGMATPLYARLVNVLHERDAGFAPVVVRAIREDLRQRLIARSMRDVTDEASRLLFATLMNATDRETALLLARRAFPDCDPIKRIAEILQTLSSQHKAGEQLNGLPLRAVVEAALNGGSLADLCAGAPPPEVASLRKAWYAVHSVEFLRPLVNRKGSAPEPAVFA